MGKFCEVCEKGAMSGHNVSHSNRKTNRVWAPNVQNVRVVVDGRPQRITCALVACAVATCSARCPPSPTWRNNLCWLEYVPYLMVRGVFYCSNSSPLLCFQTMLSCKQHKKRRRSA